MFSMEQEHHIVHWFSLRWCRKTVPLVIVNMMYTPMYILTQGMMGMDVRRGLWEIYIWNKGIVGRYNMSAQRF